MARCYGTFAVLDGALSLALHGTEHDSHAIREVRQSLAEKPGGRPRRMGETACGHAILPETSAGRLLSSHPRARGRAVSKSHRRRMKKVEAVEFASLFHRFEDEYGAASRLLVEQLRETLSRDHQAGQKNRTGAAQYLLLRLVLCPRR